MAEEIKKVSSHIDKQSRDIFTGVEVVYIPYDAFKEQSTKTRAIIGQAIQTYTNENIGIL